jgi:Putative Ig domain
MLRTIGLVTCLVFLMAACGGGGGGATPAPSGLQYAVGAGEVGSPYGPYPPSVTGTVTGYSVSPDLPAGLRLDPNTGVISGTPLAASSGTTYTVTASNGGGAATVVLTLEILSPPTALTYPSSVTGMVGAALAQVVPTLTGDADSFTVHPPLPPGLVLDPATGTVSGTPTSARLPLSYTVVASNLGGALTQSQFLLTVDPPPAGTAVTGVFRNDTVIGLGYVSGGHSGLTDKSGAFTYEEGQGITFSVGGVSIGRVATAKTLVTPADLVSQVIGGDSNRVLNVVRFLMMLDQDANANNGLQISAAVTAAAASWAPVDFDTTDLATTLGPIIQQASAADGVSHELPDAATAQAHLLTGSNCIHSGNYYGTYGTNATPPGMRDDFLVSVFPDGSMETIASDSRGPSHEGAVDGDTFGWIVHTAALFLKGSFADATYLSGTYSWVDGPGNFQAVGDASVTSTYKFFGWYRSTPNDPTANTYSWRTYFWMDDSNHVSGGAVDTLTGTVSGNTFTGTVNYFKLDDSGLPTDLLLHFPVSGTYSNTASGVTFDGQFSANDSVVTFSTIGCRAN